MSDSNQILSQGSNMSSPEIQSWMNYSWETRQQTPARLEDAAKYLSVMITIAITFFLAVYGKPETFAKSSFLIKSIPLIWCLSLIFSFLILYPKKYRYNSNSAESIKNMNEKIINFKQMIFSIASLCYIIGIGLFVWVVVFING